MGALSKMVPSFLTEYTKGSTSVSSLMCEITSAVPVAARQYGTQPETSNDWLVEADAERGAKERSTKTAIEAPVRIFIYLIIVETFEAANYFSEYSSPMHRAVYGDAYGSVSS